MMIEIKPGPKKAGCCSCCDEDCMEHHYPHDHPNAGQECGVGRMSDHAQQIDFLMSDGSISSITFCNHCAAEVTPSDYSAVMKRAVISWEEEISDEWRTRNGLSVWKEDMKLAYRKRFSPIWIVGRLWSRRPKSFTDVRLVKSNA